MRIVSFTRQGNPSWGVLEGDQVIDMGLRAAELGASTFADAMRCGNLMDIAVASTGAAADWHITDVQLQVPVPTPSKVLCVGLNYGSHVREMGRTMEAHPTVFTRFADTLVPHNGSIVRPTVSGALDYEGELCVVIGSGGRHIPAERAMEHVAGYACFNDASVRDFQKHTSQFTAGKNFPATGGCGPWVVTRDEVEDVTRERITTRLNGAVVQEAQLDDLVFSVAEIISYCSSWTPLRAGDIIATGTPGGVGAARTPPQWMAPGDVVQVEITGVGLLSNVVVAEAETPSESCMIQD